MALEIGIYEIVNKTNGKRYIGSTEQSFTIRWRNHRSLLRANRHHSRHLQNAWNKYGEDSFEFRVLERNPGPEIYYFDNITREQWYLDNESCEYNMSDRADRPAGMLGKKHKPETIEKIRQSNLGQKRSMESRKKMSLAKQGKNNPWYGTKGPMSGKRHSIDSKLKNAKLSENQVSEIRTRYFTEKTSHRKLAKEYGVSHRTIQKILDGETWAHMLSDRRN